MQVTGMKRRRSLEDYAHTTGDTWRWRPAAGTDVEAITDLAVIYAGQEADQIFEVSPVEFSRRITHAIVNQFFNPKMELVSVAQSTVHTGIVAFTWAERGHHVSWSAEELITIQMAHVDGSLSARDRIFLCAQQMRMWEIWAEACEVKIINSSTMREDQTAFLNLHRSAGYQVRGSVAYKRLNLVDFSVPAV
jgi:hypothetical protein